MSTQRQKRYSHFQKDLGVFACVDCGKMTRGNSDSTASRMCQDCWDRSGDVNSVLDGTVSLEDFNTRWPSRPWDSTEDGD